MSAAMVCFRQLLRLLDSAVTALAFLTAVKLATPKCKCPAGHSWSVYTPTDQRRPHFWCRKVLLKRKRGQDKKRCHKKGRLSDNSPFLQHAPDVAPDQLLQLLYFFAQAQSISETVHETGLSASAVADGYSCFRVTIANFMSWFTAGIVLGGPNRVVLVDETFVTRKRRSRGGFQGRTTRGHVTCFFAALEMDILPCGGLKETGRCVMQTIPNREATTLAPIISKHVLKGTMIFSDGAGSYKWLRESGLRARHSDSFQGPV